MGMKIDAEFFKESDDAAELFHTHFNSLQERQEIVFEKFECSQMLVSSGSRILQFNDDLSYPFKVNPYFKMWVPLCQHPNCYLLLRKNQAPKLLYFRPHDFWHYWPEVPNENWVQNFEVVEIQSGDEVASHLQGKNGNAIYIGEGVDLIPGWNISRINLKEVLNYLDYHRSIKSDYERYCLWKASIRGVSGHLFAKDAFLAGASELETHLEFLRGAKSPEHDVSYDTIVGFDERAAILHLEHKRTERSTENRLSGLIDAGAQYNGYASDITRTYSYRQDEFAELIEKFDELQIAIVDKIQLGMPYMDLYHLAHEYVCKFMVDNGFVRGSLEECIEANISEKFFVHGLGHYIGLNTHDVGWDIIDEEGTPKKVTPDLPRLRLGDVMQKGHVITVEPGFYFIDSFLDQLKASAHGELIDWRRIDFFKQYGGIRIEDNIYLGENGVENLTRKAFNSVESSSSKKRISGFDEGKPAPEI